MVREVLFLKQAAFRLRKLGRDLACEVAREYCRRAEYFYLLCLEADDEDFEHEAAHVNSYVEGLPWLDFTAVLRVEDPAFLHGLQL